MDEFQYKLRLEELLRLKTKKQKVTYINSLFKALWNHIAPNGLCTVSETIYDLEMIRCIVCVVLVLDDTIKQKIAVYKLIYYSYTTN